MGVTKPLSQLSPGQRIGAYTIQGMIGRGRQAEVYQAARTGAQTDVALKVFLPGVIRGPSHAACFVEEAARLAALAHPHIARLTDFGCDPDKDLCYLAMERVEGPTLRDAIAAHPRGFSRDELWRLFAPVADAVATAHEQELVHGSLRPDHILLGAGVRPVITDFSIPCLAGDSPASAASLSAIPYWAPEQAAQLAPTPAVDIYALGVLLYEMAVGDVPFKGATRDALVAQHLYHEPVPPSQHRPELDPRIERVILIALNKNPAQRFMAVREMIAVLNSAETDDYATLTLDKRLAREVRRHSSPGIPREVRAVPPSPEPLATPAPAQAKRRAQWWLIAGVALAAALLAIVIF